MEKTALIQDIRKINKVMGLRKNVLIQPCTGIGHDNRIGNDTMISIYVCKAGGCIIGDEIYIGLQVPIRENIIIGSQTITYHRIIR